MRPINTLFGKNKELQNVKVGGTYIDHRDLRNKEWGT
jgi:hypothetical protein